jgi:hypothetical protein
MTLDIGKLTIDRTGYRQMLVPPAPERQDPDAHSAQNSIAAT